MHSTVQKKQAIRVTLHINDELSVGCVQVALIKKIASCSLVLTVVEFVQVHLMHVVGRMPVMSQHGAPPVDFLPFPVSWGADMHGHKAVSSLYAWASRCERVNTVSVSSLVYWIGTSDHGSSCRQDSSSAQERLQRRIQGCPHPRMSTSLQETLSALFICAGLVLCAGEPAATDGGVHHAAVHAEAADAHTRADRAHRQGGMKAPIPHPLTLRPTFPATAHLFNPPLLRTPPEPRLFIVKVRCYLARPPPLPPTHTLHVSPSY